MYPDNSPTAKPFSLKENVVKKALDDLDWPGLEKQLDSAGLSEKGLKLLLGHLRRTNSLIMPYPNPKREERRAEFVNCLSAYFSRTLGAMACVSLSLEVELLDSIERGYRDILKTLEKCDISRLPADIRIAASLSRAVHQYADVVNKVKEKIKGGQEIALPQGPLLDVAG